MAQFGLGPGLLVAPYVGIAYGTRWRSLAGLNVCFTKRLSSLIIYDSVRVSHMVNNDIYNHLGEHWYTAQDDPIALLRAES
jgi:hypothetical protein